jgi:hypothetical protein
MSLLLMIDLDLGVVGFNQDMEEDGQDLGQRQAELLEQQRLEEEVAQEKQCQEEVLRQHQAELLVQQCLEEETAQEQQRQEEVLRQQQVEILEEELRQDTHTQEQRATASGSHQAASGGRSCLNLAAAS